jgi:hypothetical protein
MPIREDDREFLRRRVAALERSLKLARQAADVERKRADLATESSQRAWYLSMKPREPKGKC